MIVVDTWPLVAAAIIDDEHHQRCVDLFADARRRRVPLIVPSFGTGETCYMLAREGGSVVEAAFMRSLRPAGPFVLEELLAENLDGMAVLVEKYSDLPLDAADASVVAVAERLNVADVATIDLKDFRTVRPRHVAAFTLLPE